MGLRPQRKFNWRLTAYSLATLAMLALAAGAKYRP